MIGGWHDNVVDMLGLTWGWHDDVVDTMVWKLTMTIVHNLEVI